ncbi:hypothetical protein [Spirosoma sp.]|uniref:hypothetical protein n=1 Tax=Spirosoma sp. TaxID=1899569 RepID=UPI003B3AC846
MDNQTIQEKILADYRTLLTVKFDSPLVIYDKLKLLGERIQQLAGSTQNEQENIKRAADLIQSAMTTEYAVFSEASTSDDKEQTLAQLKHKAAEACQLIGIHS